MKGATLSNCSGQAFHVEALIAAAERGDPDDVRWLSKVLVPECQMADS